MNWLLKNFLRGLVIVVPVAVTLYLLVQAFIALDRLIVLPIRGLGVASLLVATTLVGFLASNFIGRKAVEVMERVFTRAPFVRLVYAAIKDLLEAFVGDRRRFDKPVTVALSDDGALRTLGFVTQEDLAFLGLGGHAAVYLPFSYSVAGSVVVVARERIRALDADSANVMALIVSGGVSRG